MGFNILEKFRIGLKKTSDRIGAEIRRITLSGPKIDLDVLDELEGVLISSDLGVAMTTQIIERVKEVWSERGKVDIQDVARNEIEKVLSSISKIYSESEILSKSENSPTIVILAGVNGTGKTTTTAKLAHRLKSHGQSVMLAACDTFRAAAIEQLKIWGERLHCDVISSQYGADASAVAYDAAGAAMNRGMDYLLIDTAGRLHTKKNLMEELKKLARTVQKRIPSAPHDVLLVIDAATGMNALTQAREFHEALGLTGLVVTKLDGTSKGGIVVAIAQSLKIPIKFIGLGEQLDDLQDFHPAEFAQALLGSQE